MSSIMRARSGLTGRSEVSEVIGALSRAEGCWTFDARDWMPRPSRATAHHLVENALTVPRAPSRANGFVLRPIAVVRLSSLDALPRIGVHSQSAPNLCSERSTHARERASKVGSD